MARPSFCRLTLLPLLLAATGCAEPGPYPSLKVRPAEAVYAAGDEEPQPLPLPDSPEITSEIAQLTAEARRGAGEFERALPPAQSAVRRAGPAGSDSWVEAQQALSRAESARTVTTRALADLDAFAVAQTSRGGVSAADIQRLRSALAEVQRLADSQSERLRGLQSSLRS
ncbi:MAG TPA: hypothetical protein VGB59_07910 [Allosphingosinicella sp.]|jgi:hypothetical protein